MSPAPDAPRFGRVITAMVTPFDTNGALDLGVATELARWLVAHGSDGLVLSGSTGESAVLTDDEKVALWEAVAGAVSVPVIAGTGSNDTAHSLEMTRRAVACGVDAVLLVTPYYNRPSQAGILEHFRVCAEAAGKLPVMLYDIPVRSGRRIAIDTMLRLAREVRNIVALKDAAADPPTTSHLIAQAPAGFEVYSGDDVMTLPFLAVGAIGLVSVAAHWVGPQIGRMIDAFLSGDLATAIAGNAELLDSFDFESTPEFPNPLPAKAVMRALGLPVGQCRLPMGPSTPELDAQAAKVLAAVGPPDVTVAPLG
ncbi:MAG TPA: 4-hydroxy-tetrahydrodipicolinate synthase [Acidimicrobiales bacterium]|jgi:4-hydroxy-tetrahydrodipicolinate synthase|nr:4-hydroxy-tetrahydrodipicolinate synthase [Acidimicrobiales bacterium]